MVFRSCRMAFPADTCTVTVLTPSRENVHATLPSRVIIGYKEKERRPGERERVGKGGGGRERGREGEGRERGNERERERATERGEERERGRAREHGGSQGRPLSTLLTSHTGTIYTTEVSAGRQAGSHRHKHNPHRPPRNHDRSCAA